jgi:sec-independent protein translocase protein TatA
MVGDILQPTHLIFVLVVALLVLGPKRLPEVGRAIGDGLRDFRSAINGEAPSHKPEIGHDSGLAGSGAEPKHEFAAATPAQPADHEFAAGIPAPAEDHEFAAGIPAPTEDHEFTQEEPAANGHELAGGEPPAVESGSKAPDQGAGEKHEFAYESTDPAPTRDEPLS